MLIEELIELANKICKQKAEEQTIELKSAQTGCPKRLYDTLSSFPTKTVAVSLCSVLMRMLPFRSSAYMIRRICRRNNGTVLTDGASGSCRIHPSRISGENDLRCGNPGNRHCGASLLLSRCRAYQGFLHSCRRCGFADDRLRAIQL